MNIQQAIKAVISSQDLSREQMTEVMQQIMTGEATPSQIGGFLVGLRMKGETVDEISAAARVMRELATPVKTHAEYLVDTCGTGGTLPEVLISLPPAPSWRLQQGHTLLNMVIGRYRVNRAVPTCWKLPGLIWI